MTSAPCRTAGEMRLALVADWLPTLGGAEHVIEEFHALWPRAPLYTTIANHGHLGRLDSADIRTTPLQKLYALTRRHRMLLPWMPRALERIDLHGYDVILSSSHAIGKGILPPPSATHICYCHTPMRYAWEMEEEYLRDSAIPRFLQRFLRAELSRIRRWDMTTAKRVDVFLANSTAVQERIARVYNRDSMVLTPPVHERFFAHTPPTREEAFLSIGRFVPYKRFDLLIRAANELHFPLHIAGHGPEERRLRAMAGPTVQFLGFVPDENLPALYAKSRAVLFPQFEDAGVVPLEAQASGTPVLAYGKGGVLDSVLPGETGLFFGEQTVASLADAMKRFDQIQFSADRIREHARQFSAEKFREKVSAIVREHETSRRG